MQSCVADEERVRTIKSGKAENNVDPKRGEFVNRMVLRYSHPDSAHASHHLAKFESGLVWDRRAKLFGLPHGAIDAPRADDCLGWNRPDIQRISADAIALDKYDGESEPCGGFRRRQSGWPRPHDREIIGAPRLGVLPILGVHTPEEGLLVVRLRSWRTSLHR